ncbi:MAG: DNA mismatch repair protein MutS [Candidatus Methanospirare jalkutatii]|nr:DNA mismatch repair protein MutS [Candidatus Methanospirare jalkutatii]
MLRQYFRIKEKYKDAILFFRVGDFYETFGEDARIASKELGIALTSRSRGSRGRGEARIPMAGVPHHAAEPYIRQLIERGYKVAICEQIDATSTASAKVKGGIEHREVVRLITPGTVIEDALLEERSSNYLLCLNILASKAGIAFVDVSTGEFFLTEFSDDEQHATLRGEIERLKPAEILIPQSLEHAFIEDVAKNVAITRYDDFYFDYDEAYSRILKFYGVISLEGFGCEGMKAAISAAGALISYLIDTQKRVLTHIKKPKTFFISDFMVVDSITLRNLEIFKNIRDGSQRGTLLSVIDKTLTGMGSRLLKRNLRFPLKDVAEINRRLEAVSELHEDILTRTELREILREISDLERITARISLGSANARDLVALKKSLKQLNELREALKKCKSQKLREILRSLRDFSAVVELIERAIVEEPPATVKEGGIIKQNFDAELDELRRIKHEGRQWLADFERRERARTGIKLKVGYNKVFGFYIEVKKAFAAKVPREYIRKQTLTDAERFVTEELKAFEAKFLSAEERIKALEYEIFERIRREVARYAREIQSVAAKIAELDMLLSFAEVASANRYCRPQVDEGSEIVIRGGRHPVVEHQVEDFVPNDVVLNEENRLIILTGPNMSGKSTFLRQIALIVLLAQIGSFVPADYAKIGIVDRIFTRVGAYDDLSMGQSSFMVEMSETANILNNATARSLVILDEIGRGTSTLDGLSIAWAVASYLHEKVKAKTLFATHFHELTELASSLEHAKCFFVSVEERNNQIFFVRKVKEGKGSRSYGIQVAELAGLPEEVIEHAKAVLKMLEARQERVQSEGGAGSFVGRSVGRRSERRREEGAEEERREAEKRVLEELKSLHLDEISPREALNKLYELKSEIERAGK